MLKIREYIQAESLEQAYELNQKRSCRIVGGMLWMKMSNAQIQTAIDLSGLGLDQIEETEDGYSIGCMVTLRELELHPGLEELSGGIIRESVKDIVGVQFRNLATIGGSIFGRFGFSDVMTCFLALDAQVELYQAGILPLREFVQRKRDNDILVRVIVKKRPGRYAYLTHRNAKTDFPVLAVALALTKEEGFVVVGARPGIAMRVEIPASWKAKLDAGECTDQEIKELAEQLAAQVPTGSNMRGSAQYRSHLARVLIERAIGGQTPSPKTAKNRRGVRPLPENPRKSAEGAAPIILNGKPVKAPDRADLLLIDFVRDHGCYSVKRGCETSGCGLCTVFLDGQPVLSCSVLAVRATGHRVDTLEGLQAEAEEFGGFIADQGAEQCGFCNPGMIMNAIALFRENPDPTDEEIKEYLAGNLCRCSGYEGQLRGVKAFLEYKKKGGAVCE